MGKANVEILWCGSKNPRSGKNGWEFPRDVKKLLISECAGLSVLHLFGGRADFGVRMDIDPSTRPDVIGDAWMPPFAEGSFDVVIMDPPYVGAFSSLNQFMVRDLFCAAAWIARKRVIWFHTLWIESPSRCRFERGWLVRVGRSCAVRCIQFFHVPAPERKLRPTQHFRRGPAIKYNHWLRGNMELPLTHHPAATLTVGRDPERCFP